MRRPLTFVLILLIPACDDGQVASSGSGSTAADTTGSGAAGSTSTTSTGSADASSSASSGTGGQPPVCKDYPSVLTFPDTSAAALSELQSFAPQATLDWSAVHGTLSLANGLGVPLDCSSNDVWAAAWSVLNAHPALFQLAEPEWAATPPFPCTSVTSTTIVNTNRTKLAGVGVQKDVLAIVVGPTAGGGVELKGVSGFYLPVLSPTDIQDCPDLSDAALEALARGGSYAFSTYAQCMPTGSGTYAPKPNDHVELGEETWEWEDGTGVVVATKRRTVRVVIDESNWTDPLLASDANCPDATGDHRVLGFTLQFDPVTGQLLSAMPGIGCIVC
ncbi:MAG: hypothetical protein U0414_03880 [Polyangiaceae bacterium]